MPPKRPSSLLASQTANVLSLVHTANRRQDDLRAAERRHRDVLADLERRHAAELREMESKHRDAQEAAESRRLDAIIAVQTAAATRDVVHTDTTAKALGLTVEATAKAFQASLDTTVKQITDRLAPLEQSRYEQGGRRQQWAENRTSSSQDWAKIAIVISVSLGVATFVTGIVIKLLA